MALKWQCPSSSLLPATMPPMATNRKSAIGPEVNPNAIFVLPTELIVIVLGLIDDEDLLSLSLLCRTLHYLALPILLSRLDGQFGCGCLFLSRYPSKFLRVA